MTCRRCGGRLRVATAYLSAPHGSLSPLEQYLACRKGCPGTYPITLRAAAPKWCPRCHETKPRSEFYTGAGYCKPCCRVYERRRYHRKRLRRQREAA
jgi:hypothetical protein